MHSHPQCFFLHQRDEVGWGSSKRKTFLRQNVEFPCVTPSFHQNHLSLCGGCPTLSRMLGPPKPLAKAGPTSNSSCRLVSTRGFASPQSQTQFRPSDFRPRTHFRPVFLTYNRYFIYFFRELARAPKNTLRTHYDTITLTRISFPNRYRPAPCEQTYKHPYF
jgi:hypothetical protein